MSSIITLVPCISDYGLQVFTILGYQINLTEKQ